jgi:ATP-dependent RNA helicase RhlE
MRALAEFKDGRVPVLVATDIAARGLDIVELPHVVNFELPNVAEDYVHRIGRTGRAGVTGSAISLVDSEEVGFLRDIEKLLKHPIERVTVDGFVPRPSHDSGRDDERPSPRPQQRQRSRQPERKHHAAPRHAHAVADTIEGMSEAARHQARPQTAIFSPKPQQRRRRG